MCHIVHELKYRFCTTTDTSKNQVHLLSGTQESFGDIEISLIALRIENPITIEEL